MKLEVKSVEMIRVERNMDPEIKRIVTEIAYIVSRNGEGAARSVLAFALGRFGAAPARNSFPR